MSVRCLICLSFLWIGRTCAETNLIQLAPAFVTASRSTSAQVSPSAAVVDWWQRRLSEPAFTIDEALRSVPGIFVQNSFNQAQDQRISIRGFGTRAAFGVREIKLLVDGLPESSPDGQTQLDNLDLSSASSIEVLRGPASALYGNASGGVINITTDEPDARPFLETRLTGGSWGFQRHQLKAGGAIGRSAFHVSGSWTSLNGYRRHSESKSWFLGGKIRHFINEHSSLTTLFNQAHTPWSQDAGGLTRAEVDGDRRQARARNVALNAGEEVTQGKLGFVYRNSITDEHELTLTQYSLFRDFANKLPILPAAGDGIVQFDRLGVGGGVKHVWDLPANQLVAGVDVEFQTDNRQRYANVAGTRGLLGLDQNESVRSVGPFVRNEFRVNERLWLVGGLRYDNLSFEAEDHFLTDGDDSGSRPLDQFSWSGGLQYQARTNLAFFANIGTAFQTPTTTEFASPTGGGGFNTALRPQSAISYEVGSRAQLARQLTGEVTLFLMQIDDELIPFTSATGRDFFRNAGRSERKGIELSLDLNLTSGWYWQASWSAIHAEYRDYVTTGGTFSGNREPGIPAHQLFTELGWHGQSGWFGRLDLQHVDQIDLNDANTAKNDAYTLMNLRLGYSASTRRGRLIPFVALNNLLNQRYNGQTRLNAFGGRYFEPSPRLAATGGITWRMEF